MRSWEDSNKEARRVKGEFRARVAELARQGRAVEALQENLRLMGIDWRPGGLRPKLVAVGSYRFDTSRSEK
jgi:hypothetical protein